MYRDEIPGWLLEADTQHQDSPGLPAPHPATRSIGSLPISTPVRNETVQQTPPSYFGALNPNSSTDSQTNET